MKTKLTKKEIGLSIFTTATVYVGLLGVMFLMALINLVGTDETFKMFFERQYKHMIPVGVSTALLTGIFYVYMFFENKNVLAKSSKIIELYLMLYIALLLCNVIGKFVAPTARPLLFFALMAAMVLRRKDAIFMNVVFALIIFIFNRFLNSADVTMDDNGSQLVIGVGSIAMIESFASLLTCFCCGIIGVLVLKRIKTRIACVMLAVALFGPVALINIVVQFPSNVGWQEGLGIVMYSAFDCLFSVLAFMFALPIFEGLFSELTPFRLRELTSDHAKLISRLKANAPGTYNHCIVVAQLAEMCATEIGEDSELARAAAYYHDVGKLKNPEMFAENQAEYDLHKELTPELSVDIIRSHTRDGAKLIKKNRLPEIFADIAVQHHGTLPIKYFYAKALKMSDGELNIANYSYAGPTPTTKIAAIIMIVDAAEAATRSLPDRSPEKVEKLVSNLVEERMNQDQFVDCNITMRELTIITHTVVNGLTGVYHSRVAYPKLTLKKK